MTIKQWLDETVTKLEQAGISTARLDALVLLEDATGKERGWLLAHPEVDLNYLLAEGLPSSNFQGRTLEMQEIEKLDSCVKRRAEHEPLAYIRNKTEFYGREFYVDHRVLEPRTESETMIDLLSNDPLISKNRPWIDEHDSTHVRRGRTLAQSVIVDVGTGSGALAITAKLEFPVAKVIATDINPDCLEVAKQNAQTLGADVKFFEGDLLKPLNAKHYTLTALLCNLPYVPDNYQINTAAMKEPRLAIFGGSDGLDLYRRMFEQLKDLGQKPEFILTESMLPQHDALADIAKAAGYKLKKTDGFIQVYFTNP